MFGQVKTDSDMIDWSKSHRTRMAKGAMGLPYNNWWRPLYRCYHEKHMRVVPVCNEEFHPDLLLFIETVKRTCVKILKNDQLIKHV